jgi:hypothetical protein
MARSLVVTVQDGTTGGTLQWALCSTPPIESVAWTLRRVKGGLKKRLDRGIVITMKELTYPRRKRRA